MGTPTVAWDAAFEGSPAGGDDPRYADDRMREIKVATRERNEREHFGATSEAIATNGIHREGSARAWYEASAPTNAPDGTGTRSFSSANDQGRLWVNSTSKNLQVYDGSAFADVKPATAVAADTAVALTSGNKTVTGTLTVTSSVAAGTGSTGLMWKTIDIGDWNMDTTPSVNIAHGLTFSKIRAFTVTIRNDANDLLWLMPQQAASTPYDPETLADIFDSQVELWRKTGGLFDSTDYNATSYNRGWITIWYVV